MAPEEHERQRPAVGLAELLAAGSAAEAVSTPPAAPAPEAPERAEGAEAAGEPAPAPERHAA